MARIMLIDDDAEFAENTAEIVKQFGHTVEVLLVAEDATQKIEEQKPDLILLDVMFPDNPAGGFDLARAIRATAAVKHLPIVLVTGINQEFPMEFSGQDADDDWMPVEAFLEKPVDPEVLKATIDELLQKQ